MQLRLLPLSKNELLFLTVDLRRTISNPLLRFLMFSSKTRGARFMSLHTTVSQDA